MALRPHVANVLKSDEIQDLVKIILSTTSIYTSTEKVNTLCGSQYNYHLSTSDLLRKFSELINSTYWEKSGKIDPLILSMMDIVSQNKSPEIIHNELKKIVGLSHKKPLEEDIDKLCKSILNNDLIALERLKIKIEWTVNYTIYFHDALPEKPFLLDTYPTRNQHQFDTGIDSYLFFQAAISIVKETVVSCKEILDDFKKTEEDISLIKQRIDEYKNEIESRQIKKEKNMDSLSRFQEEFKENPKLYQYILTTLYEENMHLDFWIQSFESSQKNAFRELHEKQKEYNQKVHEHSDPISRCMTLSQLASSLQKQYINNAATMIAKGNPDYSIETVESLAKMAYEIMTGKPETVSERIAAYSQTRLNYSLTYNNINQKIATLVYHEHWQRTKTKEDNIQDITQLARILGNNANKNPKKCFELLQKKATEILKKSNKSSLFSHSLDPDAKKLCQAIANKDVKQMHQLTLLFNFPESKEKHTVFTI